MIDMKPAVMSFTGDSTPIWIIAIIAAAALIAVIIAAVRMRGAKKRSAAGGSAMNRHDPKGASGNASRGRHARR